MPRKVDLESKLLDQLAQARAMLDKQRADQHALERKLAAERYRKQCAWERQVGRLAWNAGLQVLELSEIEAMINRLSPQDLAPEPEPINALFRGTVVTGNS